MEETALEARVKHMCLVCCDVKYGCGIFRGSHAVQGGNARIRYLANTTGISWLWLASCLNCEFSSGDPRLPEDWRAILWCRGVKSLHKWKKKKKKETL